MEATTALDISMIFFALVSGGLTVFFLLRSRKNAKETAEIPIAYFVTLVVVFYLVFAFVGTLVPVFLSCFVMTRVGRETIAIDMNYQRIGNLEGKVFLWKNEIPKRIRFVSTKEWSYTINRQVWYTEKNFKDEVFDYSVRLHRSESPEAVIEVIKWNDSRDDGFTIADYTEQVLLPEFERNFGNWREADENLQKFETKLKSKLSVALPKGIEIEVVFD